MPIKIQSTDMKYQDNNTLHNIQDIVHVNITVETFDKLYTYKNQIPAYLTIEKIHIGVFQFLCIKKVFFFFVRGKYFLIC